MRHSESFVNVVRALLLAREQVAPLVKEGWNPDTKSKYVSFNLVVERVYPALHANGILVMQGVAPDSPEGAIDVTTTFIHTSGEWIEERVRVPLSGRRSSKAEGGYYPPDAQAGGSALTYGKRYGLLAALLLVADEDDDGQGARPRTAKAVQEARREEHALDPKLMPVGGPKQKGKPIADMPLGVLRSALQHCRTNNLRAEARIIARELTNRALGGDKTAEGVIRAESRADEAIADAAEEVRLEREGVSY